jgi:molecular chaperone GrpE
LHHNDDEASLEERPREREAETSAGPGDIAAQTPPGPEQAAAETARALDEARARAEQYWSELLRARAEIANIQRRAERDLENAYKYSLEKFVTELIPVIDSLERGLEVVGSGAELDKIREGMDLTLKLLTAAVAKFGVKAIDPKGEKFDPDRHQAMSVQATPGLEANRVVAVYQKGYLLNDRLIRPAMVVVSGPAPREGEGSRGVDATA